jgi:hypothetical protein
MHYQTNLSSYKHFIVLGYSSNPRLSTWFWVVCMADEHGYYWIWLYRLQFFEMA